MTISKKAEQMTEENSLSEEINQAYIDNVGEDYATADQVEEAYVGKYSTDENFAQELAEEIGALSDNEKWPYTCIDWKLAARELMYDYFEVDGYYFRNL